MKKLVIIGFALVMAGCQMPATQSEPTHKEEMTMTHTSLTTLDGKPVSLADYKGKKVYLKFWASWCPICLAGLSDVASLAKEDLSDAVVLTVVTPGVHREKNEADFKEWFNGLDEKDLPVLVDKDGQLFKELGVVGFPTSVFLNADGEVTQVQPGHLTNDAIKDTLASL